MWKTNYLKLELHAIITDIKEMMREYNVPGKTLSCSREIGVITDWVCRGKEKNKEFKKELKC